MFCQWGFYGEWVNHLQVLVVEWYAGRGSNPQPTVPETDGEVLGLSWSKCSLVLKTEGEMRVLAVLELVGVVV